jgi:LPXTG-motif cell wall-anchored protein
MKGRQEMKNKQKVNKAFWMNLISVSVLFAGITGPISAQTTTQTEVKSGTVVYVSGNDVVVKLDDGTVKHVVVPDSVTFNVDGKELTVHDLKVGTRLTRTITTTTTNENVKTVKVVKGKVWMVNAPYVIVTLANGQNKQFKVPDGMKFNVDGQELSVFHLQKGMNLTATVITTIPTAMVSTERNVSGAGPVVAQAPTPATPPRVGALLIEEASAPAPATVASNEPPQAAAPEPKPTRLPKTGSSVPLFGLMGLAALLTGFTLRIRRLYM